jgi:hypothetical protein
MEGIVSFNNDYIDANISLEDLEKKMISEILPRFFKECGFKNKVICHIKWHYTLILIIITFTSLLLRRNLIMLLNRINYHIEQKGNYLKEK